MLGNLMLGNRMLGNLMVLHRRMLCGWLHSWLRAG